MWEKINGYEYSHQVNELGDVRSIDRISISNRSNGDVKRNLKGKPLKPQKCSNGYLRVTFKHKDKSHLIHRLVAKAFIPNPKNLPQVNHLDGVKTNNKVSNLEWISCSDNHKHSYEKLNRKEHCLTKNVILSKGDATHIFIGCNAAAKFLNVTAGSIASAVKKNHKCKGYEVKYETRKFIA